MIGWNGRIGLPNCAGPLDSLAVQGYDSQRGTGDAATTKRRAVPRDGGVPSQGNDGDDNDAGRRRALIALLVVVALVGISLYVGHVLRRSSQLEDCEMQGRTNCAPVAVDHN